MSARPKADPLAGFRQMVEASERGNGGALSAWLQTEPDLAELTGSAASALLTRLASVHGKSGAAARLRKDAASALAERLAAERGLTVHEREDDDYTPSMTVDGVTLDVPYPYIVDKRIRMKQKHGDPTLISARVIAPVAKVCDVETGAQHVTVAWREGRAWRRATVPRRTIGDARAIMDLRNEGAPVSTDNAGALVRWLTAVEELADVPTTDGAGALGWYGSGYLTGTGCIGGTVQLTGDAGTRQSATWQTSGTMAGWLAGVWQPIQEHPSMVLAVYASLSSMLLGIIPGAKGYVIDWSGRTSSGKTSALRVGASVFGPPTLVKSWQMTKVSAERLACLMRDHPLFLDDSTTQRARPDDVATVLYMATNGCTKGRGTVTGVEAPREIRTVVMSTGESKVAMYTQDPGVRARSIMLAGLPMDGTHPGAVVAAAGEHYGHLAAACAKWLSTKPARVASVREFYTRALASITAQLASGGVAGRVAGHVALLWTASFLASEAAGLEPNGAALELAVKAAGETIESVDVFRAALEHVVAWVNAKASDVDWSDGKGAPDLSKRDQIAKVSGNEICINTAALTRALDDGGWLVDAMLSEWVQRGWAKRNRSVWMYGRTQKATVITAKAIESLEDDSG